MLTAVNSPPAIDNQSFEVDENQSVVGAVVATDPDLPEDSLAYAIRGGADVSLLTIDEATGVLRFRAAPDFETPWDADGDNIYEVEVTVTDAAGLSAVATVSVAVRNLASITGTVFVDVNQNGLYEANEAGIDGVLIELLDEWGGAVLDSQGNRITAVTTNGGFYLFEDLEPGIYRLHEIQPTGVDDGAELLGSLGGSIPANDTMQLTLARTDASDYVFAEIGQQSTCGDTATIGFWQNKHGQSLIAQGGTGLADWLSSNFANIFGDQLAGRTGEDVARFYRDQLFRQTGDKSTGPAKVDAQFMALALATYFTSRQLAGDVAGEFGFQVTDTGIGTKVVNVGSSGAAFAVADDTDLMIMQLLLATDAMTDRPDAIDGFAYIYDQNGDGVIDSGEAALRTMANELYASINERGDR